MSVTHDHGMAGRTAMTTITETTTIRVFGGIGLAEGERVISVGGPRQRRLLALLVARAGEAVSVDWLIEHLWDDADRPDKAEAALRTSISRLRQPFPEPIRDWVVTEQAGYRLVAPAEALEHRRFSELRSNARRARESGDAQRAQALLDEALELWRGEPFRELEDLDWAQVEIQRLGLERLETLEERWETSLALGRHTQITGELAAFTRDEPLRERATRQYALALHRSGRTAEALRAFDAHRRLLGESSGLEPSRALVELEAAMLAGDPCLDPELDGAPLRGYRLLDQVGAGAFSVVWRAIQPSVDRPVAVKQIRSELASQPDFIRRFEEEAQLVARIEHPHIVPLIDFWRDPDAAYLVMRWLPGGDLEQLLDDGPLPLERTLELTRQIGAALSAAHRHDVIHRDVKAANVLFDDAGHAYLTDFGIALRAAESSGPAAALSTGSPAYASPEQLRREPLGPESDIFSLGVVVYECLTGRTPFADAATPAQLVERQQHDPAPPVSDLRPDAPAHVVDAVERALAKDPADRFPSATAFVAALTSGTMAADTAPEPVDGNPYLGLRAFDPSDADRFFGRRRLVSEMVRRLDGDGSASQALVIVGPSGSGKSSVVRAGLLPALRSGAIPGSEEWFVSTMVPGSRPFEWLEAALLRIAVNPPGSLLDQLRDGPRGVLRSVRRCLDDGRVLLLVVDQFEELFTAADPDEAAQFLMALATAIEDPGSPLRLVCTLRADFYHRPLEHPTFASVLKTSGIDVTPLAPDELEEAIVEPARRAGLEFERGLVPRIAAETTGQPSPLPMLQHVLAELYERRAGRRLTVAAYDELGGVSGALAARAEAIHAEADGEQRAAIRRLFGALSDPGEERVDLRRRVPLVDLGRSPAMRWVLDRFGAARLVSFDRDVATRAPTVEVAHEALLREWPRAGAWLHEDRELLRTLEQVAAAATAWGDAGRHPSDLARGVRLERARELVAAERERLRPLDLEYVEASEALARAELDTERRRVRRLRRLVVGVSVALVVALAAGATAVVQRNSAQRATTVAEAASEIAQAAEADAEASRETAELAALIGQSDALVDDDPDLAVLLALEAHRRAPGRETQAALLNAMASSPGRITTVELPEAASNDCAWRPLRISPDGATGFVVSDGRLLTVDLLSGGVTDRGSAPVSSDCVVWAGDEDGDVRWVHDFEYTYDISQRAAPSHWTGSWDGPLVPVAVGPTTDLVPGTPHRGRVLLADQASTTVRLVDAVTGQELGSTQAGLGLFGLGPDWAERARATIVSDDGARVAVSRFATGASRPGLVVLDGRTGAELSRIELEDPATAMAIDGDVGFIGGLFGGLTSVDLSTGEAFRTVATSSLGPILDVGARPDGLVVVVSEDRIEVVDPQTGPTGPPLMMPIGEAVVRPDGRVSVISPSGREASTVEMRTTALVASSIDIEPGAAVGLDGGRAAVIDSARDVELIDLRTGDRRTIAGGAADDRPIAAFPTDDGAVVFGGLARITRWEGDEVAETLDLRTGGPSEFTPIELAAQRYAPGPSHARSGATMVFRAGDLPVAHALSWADGTLESRQVTSNADLLAAVGSVDGSVHAISQTGRIRSYDADNAWRGETLTDVDVPVSVAMDGSGRIAVGGIGRAVVVDPATGSVTTITGVGNVAGLEFARDDELLVILEQDGGVGIWDATTGAEIGPLWLAARPVRLSQPWYDALSDTVWVAVDGRLVELRLDPDEWIAEACALVGRELTPAEWAEYVSGDLEQQPVCG